MERLIKKIDLIFVLAIAFALFVRASGVLSASKWIATIGKKVVAEGDDAEAVYKETKNKYPGKKPSLAKIPTGDTLVL